MQSSQFPPPPHYQQQQHPQQGYPPQPFASYPPHSYPAQTAPKPKSSGSLGLVLGLGAVLLLVLPVGGVLVTSSVRRYVANSKAAGARAAFKAREATFADGMFDDGEGRLRVPFPASPSISRKVEPDDSVSTLIADYQMPDHQKELTVAKFEQYADHGSFDCAGALERLGNHHQKNLPLCKATADLTTKDASPARNVSMTCDGGDRVAARFVCDASQLDRGRGIVYSATYIATARAYDEVESRNFLASLPTPK